MKIKGSIIALILMVLALALTANADWKAVRGHITYNPLGGCEFGKYDKVLVYDGDGNFLAWNYVAQGPNPHNYQVTFWWTGGSTRLKVMHYCSREETYCTKYVNWNGVSSPIWVYFSYPCATP